MTEFIRREVVDEHIMINWVGYAEGDTYVEVLDFNDVPTHIWVECLQ